MDEETRLNIEKLFGYTLRTDARFMALQLMISKLLGHSKEQAEAFRDETDKRFRILYQDMLEKAEDIDPALAARLLDECWGHLGDQ
jgi:hypothetical protein